MLACRRGLGYMLMNAIERAGVDVIMAATFLLTMFAAAGEQHPAGDRLRAASRGNEGQPDAIKSLLATDPGSDEKALRHGVPESQFGMPSIIVRVQ
jgi:hypothetical protein